jgi:hypothetical protein
MSTGEIIPIAALIMGPTAWVAVTWIRARHGYPLDDKDKGRTTEARALRDENGQLKVLVGRLEDRIGVLERIATDPAHRTAREIEELRD